MVEKVLSLSSALCVTFTSKVGAKGNSDGQLVCNTLHGVVRQPWQRVQFLPGVGGRWDAFLRAAEQHNITPDVQGALDLTCWHGRGHWQGESEQYHHNSSLSGVYNVAKKNQKPGDLILNLNVR